MERFLVDVGRLVGFGLSMTDSPRSDHSKKMEAALPLPGAFESCPKPCALPSFDEVYDEYVDFVWRSLRRIGVREASIEDATQEVFVVVHRRLPQFEGRSSIRTWLFAIAMRVGSNWRRRESLRPSNVPPEALSDEQSAGLQRKLDARDQLRVLQHILDRMDEARRVVLVLADLEQMTAPEIADATGAPLNTVYSRLRVARRELTDALRRYHLAGAPPGRQDG